MYGFRDVVDVLAPELKSADLADQMNAIKIPWWNAALLFRDGDRYDRQNNSLDVDARLSHSYITQLMRSGKLPKTSQDSVSVSNVLITADGLVVLGLRGGHTYSHTLHVVPAGAVEYHSGRNPLFETLDAEFFEETGLVKGQIGSPELIGRIFDGTTSKNTSYVFRSRVKPTFAELLGEWERSIDQREHQYLLAFRDDPQVVLAAIRHRPYNPAKADPVRPSVTTMDNVGSILPPGVATLLTHYAHREGRAWGLKAEGLLNGAYRFAGRI